MNQKINFGIAEWLSIIATFPLVYGVRYGWALYLSSLRGPFGLMGIFIVGIPLLIIIGIITFLIMGLLIASHLPKRSRIAPILVLLAVLVSYILPLPPIQKPPTPELEHFLTYRSDYETVVELFRTGGLESGSAHCRGGISLDEDYQHLDDNACIWDLDNSQNVLVLEFHPFDFYYPIHYVDNPDKSPGFPCIYDGFVKTQVDDNWYICVREWNRCINLKID